MSKLQIALGPLSTSVIVLLLFSGLAYAAGHRAEHRWDSGSNALPPVANARTLPPAPAFVSNDQTQSSPAALSSALSYFFISGSAFTPDIGSSFYVRQFPGCVLQMPLGYAFSAPVQLPQASQVVSITLYTFNPDTLTTVSTAYFNFSNGKSIADYTVSASSQANTTGWQQNTSMENNPSIVDNSTYSYFIQWVTSGPDYSPYLSLCGVRVAYHAPLGVAAYLPAVEK